MGASLVDTAPNSLLISTINADFLLDLKDGSRDADFDRVSKNRFDLQPLDFELGRQLVTARLANIPEAKQAITDEALQIFFQSHQGRATPRSLIHEARRLFDEWQGKRKEPIQPLEDFLSTKYERLWSEASVAREPIETDAILAHGLPIALQLLGKNTREKPERLIDLAITEGGTTINVAFANNANPTSLGRWLGKMQNLASQNLCIVRDAKLGISPTAKATQQRLRAIAQAGGRTVRVEAEALAALDAMRRLLATATSGDLSHDGLTVEGPTVRDWLKRNLPKQIIDFAEQLIGSKASPEPDWQPDALLDLLRGRKIVPLDEAVRLTDAAASKIEEFAKQHPDRICLFNGHQPVVCLAMANPAT
jgi:hypothetical protein